MHCKFVLDLTKELNRTVLLFRLTKTKYTSE